MTAKMQWSKTCGTEKKQFLEGGYSNTILSQETKISGKQSNLTPKTSEKKEKTKPQISRRKEIIKIKAEINETGTKKIIEMIKEIKVNKIDKPIARLIKKKKKREGSNQ